LAESAIREIGRPAYCKNLSMPGQFLLLTAAGHRSERESDLDWTAGSNQRASPLTEAQVIVQSLFWLVLPVYISLRMGNRNHYPGAWKWGLFASWVGVFVIHRQTRPVRKQRLLEQQAGLWERLRKRREYDVGEAVTTCLKCGGYIHECLRRLGSTRCVDCRGQR
jgi:hypothetical protein